MKGGMAGIQLPPVQSKISSAESMYDATGQLRIKSLDQQVTNSMKVYS